MSGIARRLAVKRPNVTELIEDSWRTSWWSASEPHPIEE